MVRSLLTPQTIEGQCIMAAQILWFKGGLFLYYLEILLLNF